MKSYIAIDLKSFYASQECVERGLDPLCTNLVVADESRTDKTICLAVTPSLKALGIPGRARLFEVRQKVREINAMRLARAPGRKFTGSSCDANELKANPALELDFIAAPPQMAHYMACSARIYEIYLRHVAPEDIHVYSIDEVFIDATPYLKVNNCSARDFARMLIREVLDCTGITATAGVGTNLYLCKIAMDIVAKRIPADEQGVRIAELDELSYRQKLWEHRPLTDFWRVGQGYAKKLESNGLYTMGDVANCSIENEALLYKLFGVNAELLIDHAWGWEPCTIADIKAYRPMSSSLSSGQVLQSPYSFEKARIIVREMTELLVQDLVAKGLAAEYITLTVGYDIENLSNPKIRDAYRGPVTTDHYGRKVPKHAHGTAHLPFPCASSMLADRAVTELYERIVDPRLLVRRVTLAACGLCFEDELPEEEEAEQLDMFTDYSRRDTEKAAQKAALERERRRQKAVLSIKQKYGKNAMLLGMNFEEGATTVSRNAQVGGHRA